MTSGPQNVGIPDTVIAHDSAFPARLTTPRNVYAPHTQAQVYNFVGTLTNVAEVATFQFFVLAGAGAPTIMSGWAKINIVDRAQRKGFTVPGGYDPITLAVPIQFESWINQPAGQFAITSSIEYDMQQLEWMAGRGKLFSAKQDRGVGFPATGDPPIVTVRSLDGSGNQTNLIQPNLHGVEWLISSIAYDANPIVDRSGNRRRQLATVTLTEFVAAAGTTLDSPSTRAKAQNANAAKTTTRLTTSGTNTLGLMAERYAFQGTTWTAKQWVLRANQATLKVKSLNQALPVGTAVLIPTVLLIAP